jgi:circadian clock protein KaiC
VADGVVWLSQVAERNSVVRKLQIIKLRGQASVPGLHTFRITADGLQAFSCTLGLAVRKGRPARRPRLSTGIAALDDMMGGGIPLGDSLLVAGSSGTGKSAFGTTFIAEGLRRGEPGVMVVFEERPEDVVRRAKNLGQDLAMAEREGTLKLLYLRPLDLSVDETVHEIVKSVKEIGARRLVIDSLVGFEMALAPGFREDFRESLYRLVAALTGMGLTVMMTAELEDSYTDLRFSPHGTAFLTDAIILQRYVELGGQFKRVMAVVKVRASAHSKDLRLFEIGADGMVVGERIGDYQGLLTGSPHVVSPKS